MRPHLLLVAVVLIACVSALVGEEGPALPLLSVGMVVEPPVVDGPSSWDLHFPDTLAP